MHSVFAKGCASLIAALKPWSAQAAADERPDEAPTSPAHEATCWTLDVQVRGVLTRDVLSVGRLNPDVGNPGIMNP